MAPNDFEMNQLSKTFSEGQQDAFMHCSGGNQTTLIHLLVNVFKLHVAFFSTLKTFSWHVEHQNCSFVIGWIFLYAIMILMIKLIKKSLFCNFVGAIDVEDSNCCESDNQCTAFDKCLIIQSIQHAYLASKEIF